MKFDQLGCLVREKPRESGHEHANLGDSCADTSRFLILKYAIGEKKIDHSLWRFVTYQGYLRHPQLEFKDGWDRKDFTNDQLVPLVMAAWLRDRVLFDSLMDDVGFFIKGTKKITHPAVWAIKYHKFGLLRRMNEIQGWIMGFSFRWSDDEHEGWGFRSSKGKVQDYPTLICTHVFLSLLGWAGKMPRPVDDCVQAIRLYRHGPGDFEPNADWEIELYETALKKVAASN